MARDASATPVSFEMFPKNRPREVSGFLVMLAQRVGFDSIDRLYYFVELNRRAAMVAIFASKDFA